MSTNTSSSSLIGYDTNIILVSGTSIGAVPSSLDNYYFKYLNFAQIQIQQYADLNLSSAAVKSNLKTVMEGKQAMIWIPPINKLTSGLFNTNKNGMLLCEADYKNKYSPLPNGVRTAAGSIITQPFVPSQGVLCTYNGITCSGGDAVNSTQIYNQSITSSHAYIWDAVVISGTGVSGIVTGSGALTKVYGVKIDKGSYITNKQCKQNKIDDPIIANRKYVCKFPNSSGNGSFAFCYDYSTYYTPVNIQSSGRPAQAPMLLLTASCTTYNCEGETDIDTVGKDSSGSQTNINTIKGATASSYNLVIKIPPDGQIMAALGNKYYAQGGLSVPSNDLLPPQCKREGNQYTTKPIFVYPIYSGLVITNSLIKNAQGNSQQIFIRFPDKKQPRLQTKINNKSNGGLTSITKQQEYYIVEKQPKRCVQWFPTIFQQTASGKEKDVSLSIHSNFKLAFNRHLELDCIRSLGSFAYCPLFFSRQLKFTLFFKGVNISSDVAENENNALNSSSNDFKYYLFPLVYDGNVWQEIQQPPENPDPDHPYDDDEDLGYDEEGGGGKKYDYIKWGESGAGILKTYVKSDGANFYTINIASNVVVTASNKVFYDSDFQETIYSANFNFIADKATRYPLQVFGAMLVLYRSNNQFNILNSNGRFELCRNSSSQAELIPCFSSAITKVPSTSNCSNFSKHNVNFFNLITNCNIQYSLDGVTGDLSLDGYPISAGIEALIHDQSIGQIDLDVQLINSSGHLNNPHPSIFKGFAMDISTQGSENNFQLGVSLVGLQKKLQDIKLICTPFWDGDRLESICAYLRCYANVHLQMVNSSGANGNLWSSSHYSNSGGYPIAVNKDCIHKKDGSWKAHEADNKIDNKEKSAAVDFRVGRSWNWQSPHINFNTGTSCLQALNQLAEDTSCVFVVGADGIGYFYELNSFGFPYYVDVQMKNEGKLVTFQLSDIINFNIKPDTQSKYNSIATFAFLVQQTPNLYIADITGQEQNHSVKPGSFFTKLNKKDNALLNKKLLYPWQRTTLSVQNGYLTKTQLLKHHVKRIQRSISDFYSGSITVLGNTKVFHLYQVIKIHVPTIAGVNYLYFFVNSISHSINLENKSWTTTYGIQFTDLMIQSNQTKWDDYLTSSTT